MTSIELFRKPSQDNLGTPDDWGTGKPPTVNAPAARTPTWHTSGFPKAHNYKSTELHLSNVRDNDELVPRPQSIDIQQKAIDLNFPAEHPYASHTEKFALLPSFTSPQDPTRGLDAQRKQPINSEMPANPYNMTVVKKIKGFPYRQEIQALPTEGSKKALHFPDGNFDQQAKICGNRQQFYPTPPSQATPNLQQRPPSQQLSIRSANVLRNIERSQWLPSSRLDYTGLGPANPMALDNLDSKTHTLMTTGETDDALHACSTNTFDPARPLEGRLRAIFAPRPNPQKMILSGTRENPNYVRSASLAEREEARLLHGTPYLSLPSSPTDMAKDQRWRDLDLQARPEPQLKTLAQMQGEAVVEEEEEFEVPEPQTGAYLGELGAARGRAVQALEAANRWKELESGTPDHDISQLKEKYKLLNDKEMPSAFYKHEGLYNEERAGIYRTSYDPARLANSMATAPDATAFDTSGSHRDAALWPTQTWDQTKVGLDISQTNMYRSGSLNGDLPTSHEMLAPYRQTVALQKAALQPSAATARPRVQEKEFVQCESTTGKTYSTPKLLQGSMKAATPPSPGSGKKAVTFSDNVDVQNFHENMPIKVEGGEKGPAPLAAPPLPVPTVVQRNAAQPAAVPTYSFSRCKQLKAKPVSETQDVFRSLSTNFMPSGLDSTPSMRSSYASQFASLDLSEKRDPRFAWEPGCGQPRPQSCLLAMQDGFIKSQIRKKFHASYPEQPSEIRMNINTGKKHTFFGMNAQVIHG